MIFPGKHFLITSKDQEEVTTDIFYYKHLKAKNSQNKAAKYPIYVALKEHGIEFQFQGKIRSDINDAERVPFFGDGMLYEISFHHPVEETERRLKNLANQQINLKPWDKNGENDKELYYSFESINASKIVTYGGLPIKNVEGSIVEFRNYGYQYLIIDFLYDFFNSTVFEASSKYHHIKKNLLAIPLIRGIVAKQKVLSSFIIDDQKTSIDELKKAINSKVKEKNIYEWSAFISDNKNKRVFAKEETKPHWFKSIELEFDETLLKISNQIVDVIEKNKNHQERTSFHKNNFNWLVKNYELKSAVNYLFKYLPLSFVWKYILGTIFILSILLPSIFYFKMENINQEGSYLFDSIVLGVYFMFFVSTVWSLKIDSRFTKQPWWVWKIKTERIPILKQVQHNLFRTNVLWSLVYICFLLYIIFFFNFLKSESVQKNVKSLFQFISCVALLQFVFKKSGYLEQINSYIDNTSNQLIRLFCTITFGLFKFSKWIMFFTVFANEVIIRGFQSNFEWLVLLIFFMFLLGLIIYILGFLSKANSFIVNLALPRLLMGLLTAWAIIFLTAEFWQLKFDESYRDAVFEAAGIVLATGFFLFLEIKSNSNTKTQTALFYKTLNIIIPGFAMSMFVGLVGMSYLAPRYISRVDILSSESVYRNIVISDSLKNSTLKSDYENFKTKVIDQIISEDSVIAFGNQSYKYKLEYVFSDMDSIKYRIKRNDSLLISKMGTWHLLNGDTREKVEKLTDHKLENLGQKVIYIYDNKNFEFIYDLFPNFSLRLIPGFLILSSALALFVGIFFQLLFDDKPITEPL